MNPPPLAEQLQALEIAWHQPALRRDRAKLEQLLHPRFREFGRSGQSYGRADALAGLSVEPVIWSQDFAMEQLGPDAALLTYRSAEIAGNGKLERHTNRSSLWVRCGNDWQMLFHQGTPCEAFER